MNNENEAQATDETSQEPETQTEQTTDTSTETQTTDEPVQTTETETTTEDPQVVVPVDTREMTVVDTDHGTINVIHEVTVGDLLVSTALFILIIFMLIVRVFRG